MATLKTKSIIVDGETCTVLEAPTFDHSVGYYRAWVKAPNGEEKAAVARQRRGPWRFWTRTDRMSTFFGSIQK